uniref:Uncharacterized protein n=1 Tax=Molossus molossus TaxID=27622 RepID=A0A7J8C8R1_MOLMO|nr:hypothetical protein HJG59_009880 [Molossus molossus]
MTSKSRSLVPPRPAARVPATTRMRCMTRSPHAWRALLRSGNARARGGGRGDRGGMNGGGPPELSGSPSPTHTAISFTHSNVGGAGLACHCGGRGVARGRSQGWGRVSGVSVGRGGLQIVQFWC